MSVLEQHSEATSCEVCWSAGRPDSATSWVENQPHHQHSRRPTSSSSSSLHSQQQQQQQRLPITVSQAYLHVDTRRTGAKSGQHDWCSAASRLICCAVRLLRRIEQRMIWDKLHQCRRVTHLVKHAKLRTFNAENWRKYHFLHTNVSSALMIKLF